VGKVGFGIWALFVMGFLGKINAQEHEPLFYLGENFSQSFRWNGNGQFEPVSGRSHRGLTLIQLLENEKVFEWLELSESQRKVFGSHIATFTTERGKVYEALIGSKAKAGVPVEVEVFTNYKESHNKLQDRCVAQLQGEFKPFQEKTIRQLVRRIKGRDSGFVNELLHGQWGEQLRLSAQEKQSLLDVSKRLSRKIKKRVSKVQKEMLKE